MSTGNDYARDRHEWVDRTSLDDIRKKTSGDGETILSNILDALEESALEKEITNMYSFNEDELNELIKRAYRRGFAHGLGAFAWWKDGTQFVGTCGVTLREALGDMEGLTEYDPPIVQELQ